MKGLDEKFILPEMQEPTINNNERDMPALNIRQLLTMAQQDMPVIRDYDPESPERFRADLSARELWQRGYSLRFFQQMLGIDNGTIARKIYVNLVEFMGSENVPIKQNTISNYLTGDRKWTQKNLLLVCLALKVNHNDPKKENVKLLFNMLGLSYPRFADPVSIIYVWAVEHDYTYKELIDLFDEAKDIFADLKAEYEALSIKQHELHDLMDKKLIAGAHTPKRFWGNYGEKMRQNQKEANERKSSEYKTYLEGLKKQIDEINKPIDYMATQIIEEDFRAIWNSGKSILLTTLKAYKDEFHYCSVSRAKVVLELIDNIDDDNDNDKYLDMIDGYAHVNREDIINLALKSGCTLDEINSHLENAYFAPVGPDGKNPADIEYWTRLDKFPNR